MKRFTKIFVVFLIVLCLFSGSFTVNAQSDEKQIIKVAYFNMGEYYNFNRYGNISGYDADYLEKLSNYSDFDFQFVKCSSRNDALDKLENKEIDLVGTMLRSSQREQELAFCGYEYGITFAVLAAKSNSEYIYEDYDVIGKSQIGVVKEYVRLDELKELFKQKKISPKLKFYKSQKKLEKALDNDEVDIIATEFHTISGKYTPLEKYSYTPFYFATYKGNDLLVKKLSEAIVSLNLNEPNFQTELMNSYFPDLKSTPYSKEELEYIKNSDTFEIYFEDNTKPLADFNEDTQKMEGILIDLCEQLSENSGLEFNYKYLDHDDKSSKVPNGKNQISFSVVQEGDVQPNSNLTNSFFDCQYYFYGNTDFNKVIEDEGTYKIAVPPNRTGFINHINECYPNSTIVLCDSPEECIEKLESNEVNFAFLNYYVANEIIISSDADKIVSLPITGTQMGVSLSIGNKYDIVLVSILNKAIGQINPIVTQHIITEYALDVVPDTSLSYFVKSNVVLTICIVVGLCFIISLLIIWVLRARMLRLQKNALAESNVKLEETTIEAKKANAAKTDFLSRMSHDLRTPMNVVIGLSKLGLDETDNPKAMRETLEKINRSSHFMLGLVNDILDMSKIEAEAVELNYQPFSIYDFKEQINLMIKPLCEDKNITFNFDTTKSANEWIMTDRLRFNQIFFNLLSNAAKFTDEGGRVDFLVEDVSRNGDTVSELFVIRDNGCGMSEEFVNHMFEPFSQEKSESLKAEQGTGLGLAIVKNLVTLMGGRIEVKSELGKGTEFRLYFDLILCKNAHLRDSFHSEKIDSNILKNKRVLLCEDHPLNAEIAKKLLEKVGVKTETAENGKVGLDMFTASKEGYYDAVLMDIRMPVLSGIEATKAIRASDHPNAKTVPIIAMTANAYYEDAELSKDSGMNAHLAKPIEPKLLYDTLAEYIGQELKN